MVADRGVEDKQFKGQRSVEYWKTEMIPRTAHERHGKGYKITFGSWKC